MKYSSKSQSQCLQKICAVDLFCGAGGLTHGLIKAGIDVKLGVDIDPNCEYPYTRNNNSKFLLKSVENLEGNILKKYYRKNGLKLLAGCAPCQTFSTYNQKATDTDKRWWLLANFSKFVKELLPEFVTMENVPGLAKQNVFREFIDVLKQNRYAISYAIVNCAKYGIPQHRNRLVLLASRLGEISLLSASEFGKPQRTVRDAISHLPALEAGDGDLSDPLHKCSILSKTNLYRIKASKPGGTWRDWPAELVANCHKKILGETYSSVYGRMTWDRPAPTITTQFFGFGNGRFGHPEQNRAISLREGAILQSFPQNYKFLKPGDPLFIKSLGRLIGNAVPVLLGELIGASILAHVNAQKK